MYTCIIPRMRKTPLTHCQASGKQVGFQIPSKLHGLAQQLDCADCHAVNSRLYRTSRSEGATTEGAAV